MRIILWLILFELYCQGMHRHSLDPVQDMSDFTNWIFIITLWIAIFGDVINFAKNLKILSKKE